MLQFVVVMRKSALRVVWRIYENALDPSGIERDQCLERQQVIAMNQQVFCAVAIHGFLLEQVVRNLA